MLGLFWLVIASMDNALRTWHAEEYERKVRQSKSPHAGKGTLGQPFNLSSSSDDGTRYGR